MWQYAAELNDPNGALAWRDNYLQGDVWKHWSNDGGATWGPPERILGRDGRDGFDLERQYSDNIDGPWETVDTGQEYVRERVGNTEPFPVPYARHATTATVGLTREQVNAIVLARYTDEEKAKVARFTEENIDSIINSIELDEDEITFKATHFDASEDVYNIAPVIR